VTTLNAVLRQAIRRKAMLAGLILLVLGFAAENARAGQRFDGNWAIYIFGAPGACAFGYRLPITIDEGNILYRGRMVSPTVIGLTSAGAVAIRLGSGRFTVTGSGAINTSRGSGRWTAPSFRCTGWWRAERR
jgi:hypothetical protein